MSSHDPSRMDKKTDSLYKYPNKEKAKPDEEKQITDNQIQITEYGIPRLPVHSDLTITRDLCIERDKTKSKYEEHIHTCTQRARPLSPSSITYPCTCTPGARPLSSFTCTCSAACIRAARILDVAKLEFERQFERIIHKSSLPLYPLQSHNNTVNPIFADRRNSQPQNKQHHSCKYGESIREKSASVGENPYTSPCTSLVNERERHEARLLTAIMADNQNAFDKMLMSFELIPLPTIHTCIWISLERCNRHCASKLLSFATKYLREEIGNDVWDVWPAYEVGGNWVPVFVVLLKTNVQCELGEFLGFRVFRRRYDFVSPEAAIVMNSDGIRNSVKELVSEIDLLRKATCSGVNRLIKEHSNITIVNACPYRSKQRGRQLMKEPCVVIHCLVKGLVPFDEDQFPRSISGFPTDVREGYMMMGMNPDMNDVPSITGGSRSDTRNPLLKETQTDFHTLCKQMSTFGLADKGNKSTDYNPDLLMGTGISRETNPMTGTLGGFVYLPDGEMGFLTCAHVVGEHVGQQVVQPSHGEMPTSSSVCGRVEKSIFQPGSCDETGVDAAVVKISDRHPRDGNFIWVSPESQTAAGFPSTSTLRYCGGKILTRIQLEEYRRNDAIKIGSQSGLTRGSLYLNGVYVRTNNREMVLPDEKKVEFFNQMEIQSHYGSKAFFELGDSGALVFMPLKNNELHCIGLAIGKTSYLSCIVTPIDEVLRKLELYSQFVNFGVASGIKRVNGYHF